MNYHVRFTRTGESDLQSAARYIAYTLRNPIAARRLVADVKAAAAKLTSQPASRALANDAQLAARGVRWISVRNYLIFYTVAEETRTVHIVHVMYGRRDWANLLKEEFLEEESP